MKPVNVIRMNQLHVGQLVPPASTSIGSSGVDGIQGILDSLVTDGVDQKVVALVAIVPRLQLVEVSLQSGLVKVVQAPFANSQVRIIL